MSSSIKLSGMSIDDAGERLTKQGIILKNAWLLGPSYPVLKLGKVERYNKESDNTGEDNKQSNEQPQNNNTENGGQSDKESTGESQPNQDNKQGNEGFNYSICEAYATIKRIYEDDIINYGSDALIAGDSDVVRNNRPTKKNRMVATRGKSSKKRNRKSSKGNQSDRENPNEPKPSQDNKQGNEQPQDKTEKPKLNDRGGFEDGDILSFKVDLPKEGYTLWKIQLDKNVKDKSSVISAILSKKFKAAHAIASKDLGHDGLVPLSAETYVYNDRDISYMPPFIGHANYGFDSGNDNKSDPHITINLAIAPINARTGKTDPELLIEYVYNVLGDITGGALGKLGELAGDTAKKVVNKITGDNDRYSSRYDDEDSDSESITGQLSKFLHKKFKYQGTHKNYADYLKIKKFIDAQIKAKNIAFYKEVSTDLVETFSTKDSFKNSKTMLMFY